jgi:hypothetical protein
MRKVSPVARATLVLLVFVVAGLTACKRAPQDAAPGASPTAATSASAPTPASTDVLRPEVSTAPTPDARKEEGGAVDKRLPASNALPKTVRKAPAITEKNLEE